MMMWYGGDWGWGGWLLMTVAMVIVWALIIAAGVVLVRYLVSSPRASGSTPSAGVAGAEEVLAARYARGEIGDDEYRQRLTLLRQHR